MARGTAFGLPLPICSCGVLPFYETLARAGVPSAAGVAFLVATPELGIDAVLISLPLLGADLTVARIVAAVLVSGAVALFVSTQIRQLPAEGAGSSQSAAARPLRERLLSGLRFSLGELVDNTAPWIIFGLIIAAVVAPILDLSAFQDLPLGLDVLCMALLGMPIYVCASGATPLVAVLVLNGLSPGAGLAFLLTGPATNATTFGVLRRLPGMPK